MTKKRLRCKIEVSDGAKYCHHHKWQDPEARPTNKVNKPGFIYIYTYKLLYESYAQSSKTKLDWLKLDYSIIQKQNHGSKQSLKEWSSKDHILCKIGMTTKPCVSIRLAEWRGSCKHEIIGLTPKLIEKLYNSTNRDNEISRLTKFFNKLSISKKKPGRSQLPQVPLELKNFYDGGFYYRPSGKISLSDLEAMTHRILWKRYGQGLLYCYGCSAEKHGNPVRHKEWFMVPVTDLPHVMETIDALCSGFWVAQLTRRKFSRAYKRDLTIWVPIKTFAYRAL